MIFMCGIVSYERLLANVLCVGLARQFWEVIVAIHLRKIIQSVLTSLCTSSNLYCKCVFIVVHAYDPKRAYTVNFFNVHFGNYIHILAFLSFYTVSHNSHKMMYMESQLEKKQHTFILLLRFGLILAQRKTLWTLAQRWTFTLWPFVKEPLT